MNGSVELFIAPCENIGNHYFPSLHGALRWVQLSGERKKVKDAGVSV